MVCRSHVTQVGLLVLDLMPLILIKIHHEYIRSLSIRYTLVYLQNVNGILGIGDDMGQTYVCINDFSDYHRDKGKSEK